MRETRISNSMQFKHQELFKILEERYNFYNRPEFIQGDPVSIPHRFSLKEDIEIAGFLTATISWGKRTSIVNNALDLMLRMDHSPFHFITGSSEKEFARFQSFVHRTFNGDDCIFFLYSLKNIYLNHGGLEQVFNKGLSQGGTIKESIIYFRKIFFELPHLPRVEKHLANLEKNASAKRINMFLRWMVRKDNNGVDFGIWKMIYPSALYCPLDVHSGNQSRKLGLLQRKQNDWKAVLELTKNLRKFDPEDPVKYDFALFGSGINDVFNL
jgi:uncharacterized protein (TIGR02757 family)